MHNIVLLVLQLCVPVLYMQICIECICEHVCMCVQWTTLRTYTWDNIAQATAGDQIMRYVAGGGVCHYGVSASESESLSYNTSTARADTFFGSGWTSALFSSSSCCLF